jgi:hypothetical protein
LTSLTRMVGTTDFWFEDWGASAPLFFYGCGVGVGMFCFRKK